jgi:Putative Flp pilus-assembly TadE/G-like
MVIETKKVSKLTGRRSEDGQAAVSLVLILGMFAIAMLGFAVDLTNMWFHRQNMRSAADAACQAGAMDMLAGSSGMSLPGMGFTAGTAGNCVGTPGATMCSYAAANGYSGGGLTAGAASNSVSWAFPSSVPGVPATAGNSYLQVTISENVRTYLMSLVNASKYQTLNASCTCGVVQVKAAAPMVVLHPTMSGAFNYTGGGTLDIVGGPQRGLQVNSSSSTAITWAASGIINLSAGGPSDTGSDVAIVGGPSTVPNDGGTGPGNVGYNGGTTGAWKSNVLPVSDPYGNVGVPASVKLSTPAGGTSGTWVAQNTDGCPDSQASAYAGPGVPTNCIEFSPGYYPSGLIFPNNYTTVIFKPGIYYLNGSLVAGGSQVLRMAKPAGYQQTDGLMFYFLTGSLNLSGCSGCGSSTITNVNATDLTCDGSSPNASLGMPSTIGGSVLWGQCAANGTYWDTGGDTTDSRGSPGSRGILVFQDHSNTTQPSFTGSGQLVFSGGLYFHSSTYSDVLSLNGGASSGTYVLGEIITDQAQLTGSGTIKLALNPQATTNMSKIAILQ